MQDFWKYWSIPRRTKDKCQRSIIIFNTKIDATSVFFPNGFDTVIIDKRTFHFIDAVGFIIELRAIGIGDKMTQ